MPEIINSLFGRTRNEAATSGEDVAAATTQTDSTQTDSTPSDSTPSGGADIVISDEAGGTNAIEVKPTETATAEPTDDAAAEDTETAEADSTPADDSADSDDAVGSDDADDQAEDDEPAAEAATETDAEESDEAATDDDLTQEAADEEDESAEDIEAEEAPVATETDADEVEETEPVIEPVAAETRPAAGSRGNVTVGDGVVVKVATIVVGKIDGVHSIDDAGISAEVDEGVATIKVSLVLEFGHAIKALAERIRIDVIEAVEQFLGLDVVAVDVHVSDIHAG